MIGSKRGAEAEGSPARAVGRGALHAARSGGVSLRGLHASDYADMSNEKPGENPGRRNSKVSRGRFVQPDPKARPKGVVDGHGVNIPQPGKLRKGSRKKVLQGSSDSPDEGFARIPCSASTPPRKAP